MKTINDILKPENGSLGRWNLWANDVITRLSRLRLRPSKKIEVRHRWTMPRDITIRGFDGDVLDWCNHAGQFEDTVTRYVGEDSEYEEYATICDKCDAIFDKDGGEL